MMNPMTTDLAAPMPTRLGPLHVHMHGSGPTAVLWHSLYVDDRSWDAFADRVARERTLVRITGPSHGRSEARTSPFTLGDCAVAAAEVLDDLGVRGPVDWVGCAWGGHVGILLAQAWRREVRTLAVFNAPVSALTDDEARRARTLVRLLDTLGAIRPAVDGVTRALLAPSTVERNPDAARYVADCLRSAPPRALATAIRSISLGRPDLTALLPQITVPTLLVTGDDDPLWTPEQARAAASALPSGSSAVVPGTRHLTPYEDPDSSARLVRRLWEGPQD